MLFCELVGLLKDMFTCAWVVLFYMCFRSGLVAYCVIYLLLHYRYVLMCTMFNYYVHIFCLFLLLILFNFFMFFVSTCSLVCCCQFYLLMVDIF